MVLFYLECSVPESTDFNVLILLEGDISFRVYVYSTIFINLL